MMLSPKSARATTRLGLCASASVVAMLALGLSSHADDDDDARHGGMNGSTTRTPIKHVITIIGENRSFDHVFGLYRPRHGETVSNLLSKGILKEDGTPGPHFARAAQFQVAPQPSYYVGVGAAAKTPYNMLPPPDLAGTPRVQSTTAPPFPNVAFAAAVEPALEPGDLALLTTGASGLASSQGVDSRVTNASTLPNGPFQLTGATLPYDSYTGDTIHRFYQMWQQSDCGIGNATRENPSGCLNDLYPFVAITFSTADNGVGNSMAVFNVNNGDVPFLKMLADKFAMSDNFHQSVMGGTGANHVMLGTGDDVFFSDGGGTATTPPASQIANPNPKPATTNVYTIDGRWTNCGDPSQPGVGPVANYLQSLELPTNCVAGHYYMINNTNPGFLPNGALAGGTRVPPSNLRTIGDALNEKSISWAYYGGAFNAAVNLANGSTNPADAVGVAYCQICNPFQYVTSIMGNPAQRAAHVKDVTDLFGAIAANTLPAVSFVKPDGLLDGHPASSKLGLFEAMVKNILDRLHANPQLEAETAVFIAFDEGGGYWDSGYVQPLDFFGDGVRIPFIVVSPFSRGGHVVHTYYDHVSILKFIERNWRLKPLTARSRDNLPNPVAHEDDAYVPRNSPAIGDLFDMFDFGRDKDHDDDDHDDHHGDRDRG
jgi:acid phosphatase